MGSKKSLKRQYKFQALSKLEEAIGSYHATSIQKLKPVFNLCGNEYQIKRYFLYLLKKSLQYHEKGQSLYRVCFLADHEKTELLTKGGILLNKFLFPDQDIFSVTKELMAMHDYIYNLNPGWKRINVHASRRKMPDPDLLLLEEAIRHAFYGDITPFYAYWLSQTFCSDYLEYRLTLRQQSKQRIEDIYHFFKKEYYNKNNWQANNKPEPPGKRLLSIKLVSSFLSDENFQSKKIEIFKDNYGPYISRYKILTKDLKKHTFRKKLAENDMSELLSQLWQINLPAFPKQNKGQGGYYIELTMGEVAGQSSFRWHCDHYPDGWNALDRITRQIIALVTEPPIE